VTVGENPHAPGAPRAHDRVEIVDPPSARRVSALVESASDRTFTLRLEREMQIPEDAPLRWFDGATAWQAIARFEHIDATRVRGQIMPPNTWERTAARRSPRANLDESRLLVRIVSSSVLPGGRRAHAECLEASETGCRARWPGQTPRTGDSVDLTWDIGGSAHGAGELGWIAARVARVIPRPSGEYEVCFSFGTTRSTQAARIRAWHRAWLERDRRRTSAVTTG
jgi:hypothetical protein